MVCVVASFAISWAPFQVWTLINNVHRKPLDFLSQHHFGLYCGLYLTCHLLGINHSVINPVLYYLIYKSKNVRQALPPVFLLGDYQVFQPPNH